MSDDDTIPPDLAAKLLRVEYPDQMAAASCTCDPDAMCGAHRLLKRYDEMWHQMRADHLRRRKVGEERDALAAENVRLRDALEELVDVLVNNDGDWGTARVNAAAALAAGVEGEPHDGAS